MSDGSALELRIGHQDHRLLADVMAPRLGTRSAVSRAVRGVVLDAHIPLVNPGVVDIVRELGLALTVDPFTPALQYDGEGSQSWQQLPYYRSSAVHPDDLRSKSAREHFVDEVLSHQLAVGATNLVAPYFYASSVEDAWWDASVSLIAESRRWMKHRDIGLRLIAPLAGAAIRLGAATSIRDGISQFARQCVLANVAAAWLMLSPLGKGDESYDKLLGVVEVVDSLRGHGVPARVARAGRYGVALMATGVSGFDAGVGSGDSIDLAATARSRRRPSSGGPGSGRVFIDALGTSMPRGHLREMFGDQLARGLLSCTEPTCCPNPEGMLRDWRGHTVRTRASSVLRLLEAPRSGWLGLALDKTRQQVAVIEPTNRMLAAHGLTGSVRDRGPRELCNVLEHLRRRREYGSAA